MGSNPIGDAIFFCLFLPNHPESNSCKKQAMTLENKFSSVIAFTFCFDIFCTAKNGITLLLSHCLALLAPLGAALLRHFVAPLLVEMPFFLPFFALRSQRLAVLDKLRYGLVRTAPGIVSSLQGFCLCCLSLTRHANFICMTSLPAGGVALRRPDRLRRMFRRLVPS